MDPARVRGVGLGLRWDFIDELVDRTRRAETTGSPLPAIDFLEVAPENYIGRGGRHPAALEWLRERYPVVTHGLTLSIGGADPLDGAYLEALAGAARSWGSPWHSDHLCFGTQGGRVLHELLPVAHTWRNVQRIARRVREARARVGLPLLIENISYYWHPGRAEMSEAEFVAAVCAEADCGLLLDVNNVYVNSCNFGFDVDDWLRVAPLSRVAQIHVAGHEWFRVTGEDLEPCGPTEADAVAIDSHGAPVPGPVVSILERVLAQVGPVPITLERDANQPGLDTLLEELAGVRAVWARSARRGGSE